MERVKLMKTLLKSYAESDHPTPPRDDGSPLHYVLMITEDEYTVNIVSFVSPGDTDLPNHIKQCLNSGSCSCSGPSYRSGIGSGGKICRIHLIGAIQHQWD